MISPLFLPLWRLWRHPTWLDCFRLKNIDPLGVGSKYTMVSDLRRSYAVSYCMVLLQRTVHCSRCRFGLHPGSDSIEFVLAWQEHGRVLVLYKKERLCVQSMSAQYGHHRHYYYYYLYHRYKYKYLYLKYRNTVSKSVASFSAKWTSICCIAQAKQSSPDRRIVSWCAFSVFSRLFLPFLYSVLSILFPVHSPSWQSIVCHIMKYSVHTYRTNYN